jgi:hypothetical protein
LPKPLVATFDAPPHASSDGGAILLKGAEARDGLIDGFARCLVEGRHVQARGRTPGWPLLKNPRGLSMLARTAMARAGAADAREGLHSL